MNLTITWLPPEWTVPILLAKGGLAVMGVVLLIWHMNTEWDRMHDPAQRARYIVLLGFGVLVAGATGEQVSEEIVLSYRHLGSLVMSAALAWVAVYSIYRSRRRGI